MVVTEERTVNRQCGVPVTRGALLALLLCAALSVHAESESEVADGSAAIVLAATGEATITLTPRENLLEGVHSGGFILASWSASATEGTIAFRLNPTVVKQYSPPTYLDGYIQMSPSPVAIIEIYADHDCGTATLSGTWRVCPEGTSLVRGYLRTKNGLTQNLRGGTYPAAMDAVVWSF